MVCQPHLDPSPSASFLSPLWTVSTLLRPMVLDLKLQHNSSSNNRKFWLDFSAVLFRFQNCLRLLICLSRFLFSCSRGHVPQGRKLSHIHVSFKPSSSHGQSMLVLLSVKNAFGRHTHFGMTWCGISTESN